MSSISKKKFSTNTWKKSARAVPKVGAIVISYNTNDLTRQAVEKILDSSSVDLEVVVVDNNSSDRTTINLTRRYGLRKNKKMMDQLGLVDQVEQRIWSNLPVDLEKVTNIRSAKIGQHQLHLVEMKDNLGFGRANNVGCFLVKDVEYFCFINSDAFVLKRTISKLARSFKNVGQQFAKRSSVLRRKQNKLDNLGIVAAQVFDEDGGVQKQGGSLPTWANIFAWIFFLDDIPLLGRFINSYQHHQDEMKRLLRQGKAKVGWVGGTVMMIAKSCLFEIGGFDPALFMYGEDVELCWRATQKHWDVALLDGGKVIHIGSASSSSKRAIIGEIKGLLYFWRKHRSAGEYWIIKKIILAGVSFRILIFGILRRYGRQRAYQESLEVV